MADFNHGVGTLIKELVTSKGTLSVGTKGIITAYLPEYNKFAVDFEHLSNLKKELGLPVGFKTETEKKEEARAKLAGWDPVNKRPLKAN